MSYWKTIIENALGKCADFDPDCPTCKVWAGIADLEAQLATARAKGYATGYEAGLHDAAKACDKIAGNTADFFREHRRAAGQCAAMIRALLPPDNGQGGEA